MGPHRLVTQGCVAATTGCRRTDDCTEGSRIQSAKRRVDEVGRCGGPNTTRLEGRRHTNPTRPCEQKPGILDQSFEQGMMHPGLLPSDLAYQVPGEFSRSNGVNRAIPHCPVATSSRPTCVTATSDGPSGLGVLECVRTMYSKM